MKLNYKIDPASSRDETTFSSKIFVRLFAGYTMIAAIAFVLSLVSVGHSQACPVEITTRASAESEMPEIVAESREISSPEEGDVSQISFYIVDPEGEAVAGARVSLTEKETERFFYTTSDAEGYARFSLLPKAEFELKVEFEGLGKELRNLRISLFKEPDVRIAMGYSSNSYDEIYEVPIFKSIESGDLDAVLAAIANGFDVNTKGAEDRTALHVAVYHQQVEVVAALLKNGADVDAKNEDGLTAINILADDVGEGEENVGKILRILIAHDADLNAANSSGETILMEAAYYDDPEIVTILLDAGVDTTLKNEDKETAYQVIEDEPIWEIFHRYGIFQ